MKTFSPFCSLCVIFVILIRIYRMGVICARWRKMSNFLGFPRKIVLFVLNCKNLKILRDFCDFGSYISYRGSLRAERPARRGFARSQGKSPPPFIVIPFPVNFCKPVLLSLCKVIFNLFQIPFNCLIFASCALDGII